MLKNILKYLSLAGVITVVGLGTLFFIQYLQYRNSPEYQTKKFLEEWEKAYREDMYGGDTPEETLQLFIDALKKGDTDIAAKYFIIDEQEKWKTRLSETKDKNLLSNLIAKIEMVKITKKTDEEAYFSLIDKDNIAVSEIIIAKNPYSKKWKIYEM